MYQKQINVPILPVIDQVYTIKTFPIRSISAPSCRENLSGEEDFVARDSRFADCVAHLIFVLVILRTVNVAISGRESGEAGLSTYFRGGLVYTKSEAGDPSGVVGKAEGGCYSERIGVIRGFGGLEAFGRGLWFGRKRRLNLTENESDNEELEGIELTFPLPVVITKREKGWRYVVRRLELF